MGCEAFRKFPKIGSLGQAVRHAHKVGTGPLEYRGTVKLHGTNAGVRVECDGFVSAAQSRNRVLTVDNDNMGFATFIFDPEHGPARRAVLASVASDVMEAATIGDQHVTLYGEWCGPGVQRGVALNRLPERQFVLFSAAVGDDGPRLPVRWAADSLGHGISCVADVGEISIDIDLLSPESVASAAKPMATATEEYEARCPWGSLHGIEGVGEGLVWTPVGDAYGDSELWFKTKGEQHQGKARKRVVLAADPAKVEGVSAFIRAALTDERLRQGLDYLREMGKPVDVRSTGDFLRWVAGDVRAEMALEMEASGLEWRDVAKRLGAEARAWFMRHGGADQ